jgi:hypothetical protein
MSYKPPVKKESEPLISRRAFEQKAVEKTTASYVAPSKRQVEIETETSFDTAFPELGLQNLISSNPKANSVWSFGKTFTEKLKDTSLNDTPREMAVESHPRKFRIVDMPNPPCPIDVNDPEYTFLALIAEKRAIRREHNRLMSLEYAEEETDQEQDFDDQDDNLSELYPEPEDSEDEGQYAEDNE